MKVSFWIMCLLVCGLFVQVPLCFSDEPLARALAVEGSAEIQKGGAGDWNAMTDGMALDRGDIIRTPEESRVDITYDKKLDNVLRIVEKSLVTLRSQQGVDMPKGKILSKLDNLKPGSFFSVKTPSAICGVRGSSFGVRTDGPLTDAFAYEGDSYVSGLDEAGNPIGTELVLPEGMSTSVRLGSGPATPQIMSQSEMDEFSEFEKEIKQLQSMVSEPRGTISPSISPSGTR